jgi:hypothetical protein
MFRSLSGTLSDLASSASASLGFDSSSDDEDAFVARLEARSREERDGLDADGLDVYRALESLLRASRSAADAAAPRAVDPGLLRRVVATVTEDEGRRASVEHRAAVALKRVNKLLAWRESVRADSVLDEALPNAEHFHACWPVAVHPPDAFGHAGLTERVGDQATVLRHRVQIMEAVQRLKALESRRRGHNVHKHVWIIDLEGVTVSLFAGDVRAFILDLVKLCTSKYTDTLHAMWILNTPYVFRAVWAVVATVLRSSTKEKIRMLGPSARATKNGEEGREARDADPVAEAMRKTGIDPDVAPAFSPGLGGNGGGVHARELVERAREERAAEEEAK